MNSILEASLTQLMHRFRPGSVGTVTHDEKEQFTLIKERLRVLLEQQITNFRFCFPFGRPEGALKSTLMLMERVSANRNHYRPFT